MPEHSSSMKSSSPVLLIGNDINNLNNNDTWSNLVSSLWKKVGKDNPLNYSSKQFPLVFEAIVNHGRINKKIKESLELKNFVADKLKNLILNQIHTRIRDINPSHIITTNYDLTLERGLDYKNTIIINETKYSIFRRFTYNGSSIWHIHGDCDSPNSINLGFEHYCGQLQLLRNYVVSGTIYKTSKVPKEALIKRLKSITNNPISWVDLLFSKDVHIIGLCLDFIEIDLWWLLTYRAGLINQKGFDIINKIYYYIPEKYCLESTEKLDLLTSLGVHTRKIDKTDYEYYNEVLDYVENKHKSKTIKQILGIDSTNPNIPIKLY